MLYDEEADELGTLGSLSLRKGALGSYIYAKTVDPNGPYFHMLIEHKNVFDGNSGTESRSQEAGEETPGRPHNLVRRRLPGGASHPWLAGPQRGDPGVAVRCQDIGGLLQDSIAVARRQESRPRKRPKT